jgi:hypothetical protein
MSTSGWSPERTPEHSPSRHVIRAFRPDAVASVIGHRHWKSKRANPYLSTDDMKSSIRKVHQTRARRLNRRRGEYVRDVELQVEKRSVFVKTGEGTT